MLEAFACGVPVVVPRTQGFQDTVRHDETGNTPRIKSTPYQHTLSTHPINTPYQHTLSTHPINTPYQHTLSTHPINPSNEHNPSTHLMNTTYQHT